MEPPIITRLDLPGDMSPEELDLVKNMIANAMNGFLEKYSELVRSDDDFKLAALAIAAGFGAGVMLHDHRVDFRKRMRAN